MLIYNVCGCNIKHDLDQRSRKLVIYVAVALRNLHVYLRLSLNAFLFPSDVSLLNSKHQHEKKRNVSSILTNLKARVCLFEYVRRNKIKQIQFFACVQSRHRTVICNKSFSTKNCSYTYNVTSDLI